MDLEDVTKGLEEKINNLKKFVDGLSISKKEKAEIYTAIVDKDIMVNSMDISPSDVSKLNEQVHATRSAYSGALAYARNLPATNNCDEYAEIEVNDIWDKLKTS